MIKLVYHTSFFFFFTQLYFCNFFWCSDFSLSLFFFLSPPFFLFHFAGFFQIKRQCERRIRAIFQESLLGPQQSDYFEGWESEFAEEIGDAAPNLYRECAGIRDNVSVDDLIEFIHFQTEPVPNCPSNKQMLRCGALVGSIRRSSISEEFETTVLHRNANEEIQVKVIMAGSDYVVEEGGIEIARVPRLGDVVQNHTKVKRSIVKKRREKDYSGMVLLSTMLVSNHRIVTKVLSISILLYV